MGKPDRVLMTADTVGGVWTYSLELARGLTRRGVEVALATMGAPLSPDQRRDSAAVPGLRIFESNYKLEWMEQPWDDVREAGEWLLGLERQFSPDVIHLNSYCHGALPFQAPVLTVGHSCVLSWWRSVKGCNAPGEWDRYRREVATGLAAAKLVVAPTCAMLDALEEHYGPLPRKSVAPNGRAPALQSDTASKQPFLFTSGRIWDEAKNLRAVEAVAGTLSWPVYVAGDNRHPDGGERECRGCQLLGKLSARQMAWWMHRASIYVLPARYEPFGLSILEAALAGCALVLGDIPSLREIWNGAAEFVNPDDTEGLARAVQRLINEPPRRIELAAAARLKACEFSCERMVENYLAAYSLVA